MPVLRHDVLWGQGDDLGLSGADDHRGHGGMLREGWAIAELTRETVGAMNDFGRKGGGAIQGHQQLIAKRAKRRHHAVLFKALKDLNKHRIECGRGDGIAQLSDLLITGNLLDTQQGMRVILASVLLQGALVVSTRRRLGTEDATGAERAILDAVSRVGSFFAIVRQWIDVSVEDLLEIIEDEGVGHHCLLGSQGVITFAIEGAIGNLKPLAKPKLELLFTMRPLAACAERLAEHGAAWLWLVLDMCLRMG